MCTPIPAGQQGGCGSGNACDATHACKGGKTNGTACVLDPPCVSGDCDYHDAWWYCKGSQGAGAPCLADDDCDSLDCKKQVCQ